jgi:hypothetical protein
MVLDPPRRFWVIPILGCIHSNKKFFSPLVNFRLYDIETALVEAREAQVDADNVKLIEDHVQTLWAQHTASYLGNHFDPVAADSCHHVSGYGAPLAMQHGGPIPTDPVSPLKWSNQGPFQGDSVYLHWALFSLWKERASGPILHSS